MTSDALRNVAQQNAGPAARGLDGWLQGLAAVDATRVVLRDDEGATTAGQAALYSSAIAAAFRQCGLRPGERVALVMAPTSHSVLALIGILRAGLVPVLLPCGLGAVDLAQHVRESEASALVGPSHLGPEDYGDAYLSAAALSDAIRLIASLGPGAVDGGADFRMDSLLRQFASASSTGEPEGATILTFDRLSSSVALVSHSQAELIEAASVFSETAGLDVSHGLLSTLIPSALAGLVAGPYAALVTGAVLGLHGPFDGARFLAACDADPDAVLIAPAAIAPLLHQAKLTRGDGALVLMTRFSSPEGFLPPDELACERPIVDLYAFGETRVEAHRRIAVGSSSLDMAQR